MAFEGSKGPLQYSEITDGAPCSNGILLGMPRDDWQSDVFVSSHYQVLLTIPCSITTKYKEDFAVFCLSRQKTWSTDLQMAVHSNFGVDYVITYRFADTGMKPLGYRSMIFSDYFC